MKRLFACTAAFLLITNLTFAGKPTEADQKWLQVVEKKITAGEMQVATPAPERVTLLKEWASARGYSTQVTQNGKSFRVELSKSLAQK